MSLGDLGPAVKPVYARFSAQSYVILHMVTATIVAAGINGGLAYALYHPPEKLAAMSNWGFPETFGGDIIVTTLIEVVLTYMIVTALCILDLCKRSPVAVIRDSMPVSWGDALYRTPFFIRISHFRPVSRDTKGYPERLNIVTRALSHEPPLLLPSGDKALHEGDIQALHELAHRMLDQPRGARDALGNVIAPEKYSGSEAIAKGWNLQGIRREFLKAWVMVPVWMIFFCLPTCAALTAIFLNNKGVYSLWALIAIKAVYGAVLQLPVAWVSVVSVLIWSARRRQRIVELSGNDIVPVLDGTLPASSPLGQQPVQLSREEGGEAETGEGDEDAESQNPDLLRLPSTREQARIQSSWSKSVQLRIYGRPREAEEEVLVCL